MGILLAKGVSKDTDWKELGREIFLGKSIMLLLGGLLISAIAGKEAIKPLEPLYTSMFKPVLAFFLLEMGLIASGQLGSLKRYGVKLAAFATVMPLIGALIGALLARFMGLSLGGTAMLATLAAVRPTSRCRRRCVWRCRRQSVAVADRIAGHHLSVQHPDRHSALPLAERLIAWGF